MVVTKELLNSLFTEYNDKFFHGELGKCGFSFFTKGHSYLGWYQSKEDKKGKPIDKIWIGTSVIWTKELLKIVLVHEMVHMYVYRIDGRKHDGLLGHGRYFKRQAKRLKKEFNIDIIKFKGVNYSNKKFQPKLWERILLWIFDR